MSNKPQDTDQDTGVRKATRTATHLLQDAIKAMHDRASSRDLPGGERSMARTVAAFNALTGTSLSETQGWLFMTCLKQARATAGAFNVDDYVDLAAYAALAGEAAQGAEQGEQQSSALKPGDIRQARELLTGLFEFRKYTLASTPMTLEQIYRLDGLLDDVAALLIHAEQSK